MTEFDSVRIGLVSVSDRASGGVYEDKGVPALREWLARALRNPVDYEPRVIPDDAAAISATLRELVDERGCALVLTTGGTGPASRDVTPSRSLTRRCPVLASRCARSACISFRPRSCRGRSR
jgi:molybdopterin adenylyltransferase